MNVTRLDQLTEMQRRVLRLYHRRRTAKEMAIELGISENTVKSHLTQAAARLGVGREQAAAMLAATEAGEEKPSAAPHPYEASPVGVGDPPAPAPPPGPYGAPQAEPPPPRRALLPLRMGSDTNALPVLVRLAWLPILAVAGAIGFGALANGVHVFSDLVASLGRK